MAEGTTARGESMVSTQQGQFLTFVAGGEEYALGILDVRDILELSCVTALPAAPRAVRGVVTVSGRFVPVVDLGVPLGCPPAAETCHSCVVVVESGTEMVGVLVDALERVVEVPLCALRPALASRGRPPPRFARSFAVNGGKPVMMLDLPEVMREIGRYSDGLAMD